MDYVTKITEDDEDVIIEIFTSDSRKMICRCAKKDVTELKETLNIDAIDELTAAMVNSFEEEQKEVNNEIR